MKWTVPKKNVAWHQYKHNNLIFDVKQYFLLDNLWCIEISYKNTMIRLPKLFKNEKQAKKTVKQLI